MRRPLPDNGRVTARFSGGRIPRTPCVASLRFFDNGRLVTARFGGERIPRTPKQFCQFCKKTPSQAFCVLISLACGLETAKKRG